MNRRHSVLTRVCSSGILNFMNGNAYQNRKNNMSILRFTKSVGFNRTVLWVEKDSRVPLAGWLAGSNTKRTNGNWRIIWKKLGSNLSHLQLNNRFRPGGDTPSSGCLSSLTSFSFRSPSVFINIHRTVGLIFICQICQRLNILNTLKFILFHIFQSVSNYLCK